MHHESIITYSVVVLRLRPSTFMYQKLIPILPVVDKLRMKWVFPLGVMQLQCTQRDVLCNIIMSRVARTVGIHSILNDICLLQKPIFFLVPYN